MDLGNIEKMIDLGREYWAAVGELGLIHIRANPLDEVYLLDQNKHKFINFSSFSYLGIDSRPELKLKITEVVKSTPSLNLGIAQTRMRGKILEETELQLGDLWKSNVTLTLSATEASMSILPLLACGYFTTKVRPLMVFAHDAHFSMKYALPICGNETEVTTIKSGDLESLEQILKSEDRPVVFVSDGTMSMGGRVRISDLLGLQNRYGLLLYFDDAHSISVRGKYGEGFIKSEIGNLNEKTFIVGSLSKAFGAAGGFVMTGLTRKQTDELSRHAGPFGWSQPLSVYNCAAIQGSIQIHLSSDLRVLQNRLTENCKVFDRYFPNYSNETPIRFVPTNDFEQTKKISKKMFEQGFYVSPVFFPVIKRGTSGIRIMFRSNLPERAICNMAEKLKNCIQESQ